MFFYNLIIEIFSSLDLVNYKQNSFIRGWQATVPHYYVNNLEYTVLLYDNR